MKFRKIDKVNIKHYSGGPNPTSKNFKQLKRNKYTVIKGFTITGEAPKEFIRMYEYGRCKKNHFNSWSLYIAKTGHKHYPVESITEHLNNEIGRLLNFNLAQSNLVIENEQLRFLSLYFTKKDESLVHGANIIAGYLEDKTFFEEIERNKKEKEFFTIETVHEAFNHLFHEQSQSLYQEFLKMLLFDAFIGINDRHHYNWGVLVHIKNQRPPKFSPIYDSARSLFWNFSQREVQNWLSENKLLNQRIKKYASKSKPKVGIDGKGDINHFDMIKEIYTQNSSNLRPFIEQLYTIDNFNDVISFINKNFAGKLSDERIELISRYLITRCEIIQSKLSEASSST